MSNLLEIYDLMEWGEVDASKRFWADAKENLIDEDSFALAFKKELEKLNLWKLFDPTTKLLASKGSYGEIKKALEADPNNWTLKALQRLWVLQFKNNAKTQAMRREEQKLAREEQRKRDAEKREADRQLLLDTQAELTTLINNAGIEFVKSHKSDIHTKAAKMNSTADALKTLTKEILYTDGYKVNYSKDDKDFEAEITASGSSDRTPYIFISIKAFAGFNSWYVRDGYMKITVESLENKDSITEELNNVLNKVLSNLNSYLDNQLQRVETDYNSVEEKINLGKKAQADVEAGKPTDPDFSAQILATFSNGYKKANDEYHSWASWKYDDGDSGAAFEHEKNKCLEEVALYVLECNWVATKGNEVIASWNKTDSTDKLYKELNKLFGITSNIDFELVK